MESFETKCHLELAWLLVVFDTRDKCDRGVDRGGVQMCACRPSMSCVSCAAKLPTPLLALRSSFCHTHTVSSSGRSQ